MSEELSTTFYQRHCAWERNLIHFGSLFPFQICFSGGTVVVKSTTAKWEEPMKDYFLRCLRNKTSKRLLVASLLAAGLSSMALTLRANHPQEVPGNKSAAELLDGYRHVEA